MGASDSPRDEENLHANKRQVYVAALSLAYQSLGVVYGDLSTSPLYVYKCTFSSHPRLLSVHFPAGDISEDEIFGVFSFIFWTLTLIPLLKYAFLILNVDDNGEGGTFALYSLLCRHAKLSLLPNQQQADEEVSTYKVKTYMPYRDSGIKNTRLASALSFAESNYHVRAVLLVLVLLGTCMVIGDGIVTPSISVFSAVSGINGHYVIDKQCFQVLLTCVLLVSLFSLQQYGTHRVAFLFAPVVILWLLTISSIGIYNVLKWNPTVIKAVSPHYMYKYIRLTGVQGWLSFGGIVLCLTGTEAMFANLGHFSPLSIKVAFAGGVYPCIVLSYMGQAAFLSKNPGHILQSFYKSIPDSIYWPVVVIATLASVVASQSVISATFSIVNQCKAMGCFPHVKVLHTSIDIPGQIYIPEINWMLMLLSLSVTLGFRDTSLIGNAYGLAVTTVMLVTTFLMFLVVIIVWRKSFFLALLLLLIFGTVESVYFSASLIKVPKGGWVPLALALIFMAIMCVWHYGTAKKCEFEIQNRVSMKQILSLGPSLGMVRVPGIGLVYSNLVTGVPCVFCHFITNIPAFHEVLVFVCVKSVLVPHVPQKERFLVGRIGPRAYMMFRCIVRYGYKDVQEESRVFEEMLVDSIDQFVRLERMWDNVEKGQASICTGGQVANTNNCTLNGCEHETAGMNTNFDHHMTMVDAEISFVDSDSSISINVDAIRSCSNSSTKPESFFEGGDVYIEDAVTEEDIKEAKAAGVTYVLGRSIVRASRNSSFLKRAVINHAYSFLKENCRSPALALHIPHPSLIRVGMVCHV
ncbi:hypothetical protein GOP47_0018833 [Adiantum capillus-veneris]|uniref:Potassium transporter n=1 Tax=Adiantum capillus-veneris TaxID=13818 RepID=A0A9D4UF76_ADICA|nr:hypothetical protein GOP47_0018833 [Adiantum capillus-veneris]